MQKVMIKEYFSSFRSILSRNPTEDDLSLSSKVINDNGTYHGTKMITWSLLNTREFIYIQ